MLLLGILFLNFFCCLLYIWMYAHQTQHWLILWLFLCPTSYTPFAIIEMLGFSSTADRFWYAPINPCGWTTLMDHMFPHVSDTPVAEWLLVSLGIEKGKNPYHGAAYSETWQNNSLVDADHNLCMPWDM